MADYIPELNEIVDIFYQWSLEQGQEEECGDACEGAGWAALFLGPFPPDQIAQAARDLGVKVPAEMRNEIMRCKAAILYIDTQGFKSLDTFDSVEAGQKHWETVQRGLDVE